MFVPGDTRRIMRQFGIQPDKRLGQNFLVEQSALDHILQAAEISQDDVVLEIGAGLGVLTCALAARARRVIAIEFDERLLPALQWTTQSFSNVEIVRGDVLGMDLDRLTEGMSYKVVANIPYNITSHLIRKLMEASPPAELVVLTIQLEVAQRIVAQPGSMSLLALSVQVYGVPRIAARIPSGCFFPRPSVDSAVIRIDVASEPPVSASELTTMFNLARAGFGQKRKQLKNALSHGMQWTEEKTLDVLTGAGVDPKTRAQELRVEQWIQLMQLARGMAD